MSRSIIYLSVVYLTTMSVIQILEAGRVEWREDSVIVAVIWKHVEGRDYDLI
jgi:hypothetical protein